MPRLFHITYFSINCYSVLLCVCWQVWRHNIDTYCTLQCYLQVPGNVSLVWHVPSLHLTRWTHSGAHCCHPVRSVELSGPYYAFIKSSTWGTWMRLLVDIFRQRPRCFHNYQRNFCWTILLCNLLQICIFYHTYCFQLVFMLLYLVSSCGYSFYADSMFSLHPVVIAFMQMCWFMSAAVDSPSLIIAIVITSKLIGIWRI